MSQTDNIRVCRENREIVRNNRYFFEGRSISFDHSLKEHQQVIVLSPEKIRSIIDDDDETFERTFYASDNCEFRLTNGDSLSVKTDIVLNFANAVRPGGAYLGGANAQEEALCRQSTLYASIASRAAAEMYRYNDENRNPADSDYMLISPCVEVFRDVNLNTLPEPYTTAVITAPAPNLYGRGKGLSAVQLHSLMTDRIRILLYASAYYGYRNITLGAWGCGAFGHNPYDMTGYFREVLVDEKMSDFFDSVTFAILDKTKKSDNYIAFEQAFSDKLAGNCNCPQKQNSYILASRPFPVCNHIKDIDKHNIGYAQGIFTDGTPFEAELWTDSRGEKNLTVVMPVFDEEKAVKTICLDEEMSANAIPFCRQEEVEDNSVLHIGMTDDGYEDDTEISRSYSEYLEEMGVLRFADCRRNCCVEYSTDIAGSKLAVINTFLGSEDDLIAQTDLKFRSFLEDYFN
ncbi:MAG: TIGR02452 family protein [Ruminiclostridium sp.]